MDLVTGARTSERTGVKCTGGAEVVDTCALCRLASCSVCGSGKETRSTERMWFIQYEMHKVRARPRGTWYLLWGQHRGAYRWSWITVVRLRRSEGVALGSSHGIESISLRSELMTVCMIMQFTILCSINIGTLSQENRCSSGGYSTTRKDQDEQYLVDKEAKTCAEKQDLNQCFSWVAATDSTFHRQESDLPENKIPTDKLRAKQASEISHFWAWDLNILLHTKVYGVDRKNTTHASWFGLVNCAYSLTDHQGTQGTSKMTCLNKPVYAFGQMYWPRVMHRQFPVKLEQVVACCHEHEEKMRESGLYPLPLCTRVCKPGQTNADAESRETSPQNERCTWLAVPTSDRPFFFCSRSHYKGSDITDIPNPYQANPFSKVVEYSATIFDRLPETSKYCTKVTFPVDNLEGFKIPQAVDPTVGYETRNDDRSIIFWLKGEAFGPEMTCTNKLLMRTHRYTSRTNQVLLHSITSTSGLQASPTNCTELGITTEATPNTYHPIVRCTSRV